MLLRRPYPWRHDPHQTASGKPGAVHYLSQQFVEELCSAHGLTDRLLQEIERVIFEAHPATDRNGAIDFGELLDQRASLHRQTRRREADAVALLSSRIAEEYEKDGLVPLLEGQVAEKRRLVEAYTADRAKLVPKGGEDRARRHATLAQTAERVREQIRGYANQRKVYLGLKDEVRDLRQNRAPEELRQTQARHAGSGMKDEQWAAFLLDYKGDVDAALSGYIAWTAQKIAELKGAPDMPGSNIAPVSEDADLSGLSLAVLEAELDRVGKQVSADKEAQRQYAALTSKIATESAALKALGEKLADACGAKARIGQLQTDREEAYGRAIAALVAEQEILEQLYGPLKARLASAEGTLRKLSFSVARVADAATWAAHAEEELLDLRKQGAFRGRGTLALRVEEELRPVWETGTAEEGTVSFFVCCRS